MHLMRYMSGPAVAAAALVMFLVLGRTEGSSPAAPQSDAPADGASAPKSDGNRPDAGRPAGKSDRTRPAPVTNDERFHKALLSAAKEYPKWQRGSDSARWAPTLCAAPPTPLQDSGGTAAVSRSDDADTHGRKLYDLFVSSPAVYYEVTGPRFDLPAPRRGEDDVRTAAAGFTAVKESFTPVEITDPKDTPLPVVRRIEIEPARDGRPAVVKTDRFKPWAKAPDGKTYKTGERRELFVMIKMDPETAGTDQGWVYGTVTPDGAKVTSSGQVASCMECHKQAKHDRLFGLHRPRK